MNSHHKTKITSQQGHRWRSMTSRPDGRWDISEGVNHPGGAVEVYDVAHEPRSTEGAHVWIGFPDPELDEEAP